MDNRAGRAGLAAVEKEAPGAEVRLRPGEPAFPLPGRIREAPQRLGLRREEGFMRMVMG